MSVRYPLSFAQRRALALDQRLPYAIELDGEVDPAALQRSVDALVARHATLRTTVDAAAAEQVVAETGRVVVEHAVRAGPDGEAHARELAARPFDLQGGPLLRVALVATGPARSLLVLVAHGVVTDEAGLAVLLDELSTLYRDAAAVLPQLWMDYGDVAVWQLERLRGEELERQVGHWRALLDGALLDGALLDGALLDGAAEPAGPAPAGVVTAALDPGTVALADPAAVVLAGYAAELARRAHRRDVVIGLAVDGRVRPELVPVVGPFADSVPVRIAVAEGPFSELVAQVRRVVADARAHAELPYELLAAQLRLAPPAARFSCPAALPAPDLPGVRPGVRTAFPTTTDVGLDLTVGGDGTLTLAHRPGLDADAGGLLHALVALVERAGRDPDAPVGAVPEGPPPPLVAEMLAIWAELIPGAGPIGPHDNLFVLGAASLAAVRFASRIADAYGVQLSLHSIVTAPTVAQLAGIVAAERVVPGQVAPEQVAAGHGAGPEPDPELGALSDGELDDLLRAVLAARDRRREAKGDRP